MISVTLQGRADDKADIYADGVFVKTIISPFSTSTATLPDYTRLLAVRAENTGGGHGFIIKLSNGFGTSTHWRCNSTEHNNWIQPSYNDDNWRQAKTLKWARNWDPHLLEPAVIIWTQTPAGVVYCRGWPSKYYTSE